MPLQSLCVFCGSSLGARPAYAEAARQVGQLLAERRIQLVYGGAHVGLMGIVADACLTAGGEVVGVIPQAMVDREIAHTGLTELHVVHSMHERKAMMADLSDAFLALPGGFGTFEELCEAVTWSLLGLQRKPCAVLNVEGYYDFFLKFLDQAVEEAFMRLPHRALLLDGTDAAQVLEQLAHFQPDYPAKWMTKAER